VKVEVEVEGGMGVARWWGWLGDEADMVCPLGEAE
jgi:hypothetical protein